MRTVTALALVAALAGLVAAAAFAAPQGPGDVTGSVRDANDRPVRNVPVRLLDLDSVMVVKTTTTTSEGAFAFTGVAPGNYVVEVVDATGKILGTSGAVLVAAGQGLGGILVTLESGFTPAGLMAFFTSTKGVVVLAAAGAGVGFAVYEATKSGSR